MYTYSDYCCYRPPMPGGIPKGAVGVDYNEMTIEDAGGHTRHVWGTVDYDRKLTDREISDYELEYAGEGEV